MKVGCSKLQYTEFHNLKTLVRKTRMPDFDKTYKKKHRGKKARVYLKITSPTVPARPEQHTWYSAGESEDRIPVEGGGRFSATVQTGPGAHPASYTMGTGSFPGVKRPGRGNDHPPYLVPSLKKEPSYNLLT